MRPVTWKSGTATRVRSPSPSPMQRSKEMLDVTMPTCVPNAPFGRPVVPEVYMMNAVSSSSTTTAGGRSRVSVRRSSGSVPAGGRPAT